MQRNLDAAQNKSNEAEQTLWSTSKLWKKNEDVRKLFMTKLWQLMQSRDTKNMNLDKDLEEILSKMKTNWLE